MLEEFRQLLLLLSEGFDRELDPLRGIAHQQSSHAVDGAESGRGCEGEQLIVEILLRRDAPELARDAMQRGGSSRGVAIVGSSVAA